MPVRAVCPECGATTTIDNDTPKKSVDCRQCGSQIAIPGAKPAGPPPLPKKEAPAAEPRFEVLDDEEADVHSPRKSDHDSDERPAVRTRDEDDEDEDERPTRARRRVDDDDDDDDERPLSRSRDEDDEDEDDEDEPPRRARAPVDDDDEDDDEPPRRARARVDDDDEDEDEPPRRARARVDDDEDDEEEEPPRRAHARVDDDEDDEEDEPPRRKAAARSNDDDEDDDESRPRSRRGIIDDDDDDDEEPRRPIRRSYDGLDDDDDDRPKSGKGKLILVGLIVFLLVGAAGGAATYFLWPKSETKVVKNDKGTQPGVIPPVQPAQKRPGPKIPHPKIDEPNIPEPPGLPITPVKFDGERKTILLPDKIKDIRACGDGRFLVLGCAKQNKLLIYDVSASAIVKEISTEGKDVRFAGGATKLLLADNKSHKIERYDLIRMAKDKDAAFPFAGKIEEISLGSGSSGPALVVTSPAGPWPFEFLDVETLGKADVGWTAAPAANLPRAVNFSAAANGSRWAGIPTGANALGAVVVSREGKKISADWVASDKALGFVALSADGVTLCSRLGATPISASVARAAAPDTPGFVCPSVSGPLFVHVLQFKGKDGNSGIRTAVTASPNKPAPKIHRTEIPQPYAPGDRLPPDRHIHFVPEAHALVIYPSGTESKLEIVKLNPLSGLPPGALVIASTPPDMFSPGKVITYKVRTIAPGEIRAYFMSGPGGARIRRGIVTWTVPANENQASVQFRLSVSGPTTSSSQNFVLFNSATPAPTTPAPKIEPKSPTPKEPPIGVAGNIAPGAKLIQESAGRLPISAPEMKEAHIELDLPGPIRDACVAGGGRFIIFHCPTVRKLAIFDVNTLKIEHSITVNSDDLLFAASMEKLFVIYPDEKVVIRYSLASFKPEADINLDVRQRATAAAMGSATAGPLILGGIPAQNNASKMALTFLDVDTMKEVAINKTEGDFKVNFGSAANLRVSADGRTLGAWFAQLRPSGLQVARLAGNTISGSYVADTVGHVTPGPDGQTIFTEKGMYTAKGMPTGHRESAVPALQGNWYVTLAPAPKGPAGAQQVSVWQMDKEAALAQFSDLPGFDGKRDPFERDNPTLALDRRLFLIPDAKILIVVPPAANKLHVYRVEAGKK